MISVDFLVHTLPKDKGKPVHEEIIKENFESLTSNEAGIYYFLQALDEEFPGTLEACGNDNCWVQIVWYNRYCVQLPCLPRASEEVFSFAKKEASAQGLCLYRFDKQTLFSPKTDGPKVSSKAEKTKISSFFSEIDEWNSYAKTTAGRPYEMDAKIKLFEKDVKSGNGPAMQLLAQMLAFKAKHPDTNQSEEKPLIKKAFKYATAVKDKAYERGIISTVMQAAEYLDIDPAEFQK